MRSYNLVVRGACSRRDLLRGLERAAVLHVNPLARNV